MEYKDTLNMTKSDFEMRGNLPIKEPILVKNWQDNKLYEKMNLNRKDAIEFILHDGPPYANGDMHCGHMLNRILKDIIVRYKNMAGFKTPFVFGWDTHGLPIENMVTKSGVNRKTTPIIEFREKCKEYALKQVEKQKEQIRRLGLVGDFDNPYLTLTKDYEATQLECFKAMALKGLIYKGLKPVYWSPSSESALAEAEIEYQDVLAHSIYVAFNVKDGKNILPNDCRMVIWTTTPWTLPSNLAISAHPDFIYGLYETSNFGKLVFLAEFEEKLTKELELKDVKLIKTFKGSELEYVVCKHPFYDRDSLVIVGTHVTNDSGTGLVHTAPGHGVEDYQVCLKYKGLTPYCPVDEQGKYDKSVGKELEGLFYEDANEVVLKIIAENKSLLKHTTFTHSYPHDWRTKKPLIFRATSQWFCSIEPIREKLIKQIHETKWYPSWGENRMVNMIKDRADWCISRQRAWGVPIPIIYCEDGTPIIDEMIFDNIIEMVKEYGSNIWYEKDATFFLPKGYRNIHSPNGKYTKEKDIMDVWFDSGSSFNNALRARGYKYPADLYLEGSDQYRGWFNASLIVSSATFGVAPFKSVASHGWVLDENGEQMHKSKGNGVDPTKIANVYGADVLRLWCATVEYTQDVRIGNNLIKQVSEQYRKIRNTLKFISWNVVDFDPTHPEEKLETIDLYILKILQGLINETIHYYDIYNFSFPMMLISNFCSTTLSSGYFALAKDVLYCDKKDSKRRKQMQTVLYKVGDVLLRLLNPILPFTMDEFNKNLPGERVWNAQLLDFPKSDGQNYEDFVNLIILLGYFIKDIMKALETKRNEKVIGSSQEAHVYFKLKDDKLKKVFDLFNVEELRQICIVSELTQVDELQEGEDLTYTKVLVKRHSGHYCSRCWYYYDDAELQEDGTYLCKRCKEAVGK